MVWALAFGSLVTPPGLGRAAAQPADATVFVGRAIVAYQERRYEAALAELREALELDPKSVDAHYYSGLVQVALGRLDDATRSLEQARALAPEDDAVLYQLGSVYVSQGRPQDARPILEQAFARNPRRERLGSLVGTLRYQQGDYTGALRALEAETSVDPDVQQLTRLYRGLALGQLGMPERALAEVEEAIRQQPGSPLTGPAERLRDSILAASARQRRFSVELRGGVYYDTNVSASPLPSTDAVSEQIRVSNVAKDQEESPGALFALRLEYAWLRQGPWEATVGYSFFQTLNTDAPDFNIQDHLGVLSGFYRDVLGAFPYQLGAQYAFDYALLGGDSYLQRHGVTLFGSLAESSRHLTTLQGRIEWKDFADDPPEPEESQDATNGMVGVVHTMFFGGGKHLIRLGYQFDVEAAERSELRLHRAPGHRRRHVHPPRLGSPAPLRLRLPSPRLSASQHDLSQLRPRHGEAEGRRAEPRGARGAASAARPDAGRRVPPHGQPVQSRRVLVRPRRIHLAPVLAVLTRVAVGQD